MNHFLLGIPENLEKHAPDARMWAVAIMRDDLNKTYQQIGNRMGLTGCTCRYLYKQYNIKRKLVETLSSKQQTQNQEAGAIIETVVTNPDNNSNKSITIDKNE